MTPPKPINASTRPIAAKLDCNSGTAVSPGLRKLVLAETPIARANALLRDPDARLQQRLRDSTLNGRYHCRVGPGGDATQRTDARAGLFAAGSGLPENTASLLTGGRQIVVCVVLLSGAFLFGRNLIYVTHIDPGFDAAHIVGLDFVGNHEPTRDRLIVIFYRAQA